jgi:hypothetical protein
MTKYKFLYIDDENDETTAAIADGLKSKDLIDVSFEEPKDFKSQITDLKTRLKDFDGLILDLRLDGKKLDIAYNAPAIAQEIRMIVGLGEMQSCPIILCSTDDKMRATYEVERICHEHFDYKFTKQASPPWAKFRKKIVSLAEGYKFIPSTEYKLEKLLGRNDLNSLDERVLEMFIGNEKHLPVHEYASFVIKELFHQQGPLIKEKLLAARLGIDIAKSDDWQKLLDTVFKNSLYTGVFSDGWTRWWADMVLSIFKELADGRRLNMLNAAERVKIISEKTGLTGLIAAEPMKYNKSTNFWVVCEGYKTPLDPLEGFKIHTTTEPKAWQESKFISFEAIVTKRGPRPHSSENKRINSLKEELSAK